MFQITFAETNVPFVEILLCDRGRVIGLHNFKCELLFGFKRIRAFAELTPKQ